MHHAIAFIVLLRATCAAALAVTVLALACTEPAPVAGPERDAPIARVLLPYAPLAVKAGLKVEQVDAESIRDLVEVEARFTGLEPINPNTQPASPHDIQLRFELAPAAGVVPCWVVVIPGNAWAIDGGGSFKFEVSDAQELPAVFRLLKLEDGQVAADFTSEIAAVSAGLQFVPNEKAWSLTLELAGIMTPTMTVGPMHAILGALAASLVIDEDELAAAIRESEVAYAGAGSGPHHPLAVKANAKIEQVGEQTIREHVATSYFFTDNDPIDPNTQPALPRDILIRFELDPTGNVVPRFVRFIPSGAWEIDGGGSYKFEVSDPQLLPAVIQIVKLENGQLVADLTSEIESVQARLEHVPAEKGWLLSVELRSTEVIAPMFYPMLGAGIVSLEIGEALGLAEIREGEVAFF